ncbi:MAG TPA: copper resistance CopC family protein [Dermatophilaceae bacterium]|nr:copper resistance CopC family protein [Dermatophilaceae bacterium]
MTVAVEPFRRIALALVTVVVAALVLLGQAGPAGAHSQLVRSTPVDGAVLAAVPASVELLFSEDINPNFAQMIVRGPDGAALAIPAPTVTGPTVTATMPQPVSGLPAGTYAAAYRVTSADGHPIAGQISFTVKGSNPASASAVPGATIGPSSTPNATPGGVPGATAAPAATTVASLATNAATTESGNLAVYILTGAGALGLIVLGGLLLRSERRSTPVGT